MNLSLPGLDPNPEDQSIARGHRERPEQMDRFVRALMVAAFFAYVARTWQIALAERRADEAAFDPEA